MGQNEDARELKDETRFVPPVSLNLMMSVMVLELCSKPDFCEDVPSRMMVAKVDELDAFATVAWRW
jgi:hypothetical protein